MRAMSTLIIVLVAAISVASGQQPAVAQDTGGASRAPEQPPASPQLTRKAVVYVYREKRTVGGGVYNKVYVNGDYLASLHNGSYAQREVLEGSVVFSSMLKSPMMRAFGVRSQETASEMLRLELEAGNTYYVKLYVESGGRWGMKLMAAAAGAEEMKRLHPAKE